MLGARVVGRCLAGSLTRLTHRLAPCCKAEPVVNPGGGTSVEGDHTQGRSLTTGVCVKSTGPFWGFRMRGCRAAQKFARFKNLF
ncbi:MAG TPA: hypothetical protein DD706_07900 [Nitrospiraceae bacterium]|nr:hypothetical protein [Nitrospiraceae bacterium]